MALELLAPAGSPEGVRAVCQNGADAVYLGLGDFNARRGAKNFTMDRLREAVDYCHLRGVHVYVTLNTLLTDRELEACAPVVREIAEVGADAVLVQDLGVLHMVRQVAPELPVHAGAQMTIHNLAGAKLAAKLGMKRVVLARELSEEQIAVICKHGGVEVEVFVHGALCMSYSGQCLMSAALGGRSGNRGLCTQPCRMDYGFGASPDGDHPLSLKDLTLSRHIGRLEEMGVSCLRIEGRMRRPEYAALVTRILAHAIKERQPVSDEDMRLLEAAFSRQGLTDGYFTGQSGADMFGVREEPSRKAEKLFRDVRQSYKGRSELSRVPVEFYLEIRRGTPSHLTVEDVDGRRVTVEGPIPEQALSRALLPAEAETQLYKTGGTPYLCKGAVCRAEPDLYLSLSAINALRRSALERLSMLRTRPPERTTGDYHPGVQYINEPGRPELIVQVHHASQLSRELIALMPDRIYCPLTEMAEAAERLKSAMAMGMGVAVVLPRIIGDHEAMEIAELLDRAVELGIGEALVSNIGHIGFVRAKGLVPRGDYGLNIFNAQALKEVKRLGLSSATLSFELNLAQVRELSKNLPTELVVYGRMPLMITENCIVKNKYGKCVCTNNIVLHDRKNTIFPVLREFKCRSGVYHSQKIFLADRQGEYERIGLWGARLLFTTENPRECIQVTERYLGRGKYEPNAYTRGLYDRGVE